MLYLDNAATTLKKPACVYKAMIYNTLFCSANAGRGGHKLSLKNMERVVETQELLAELFNIDKPQNIALLPNATYALNMAILGTGGHVVVTQMEHNSVLRPAHIIGNYSIAKADKKGFVNAISVENEIRSDTKLIVCTHASNVCGTIQPINEIVRAAHRHGAKFLLDASQTAGSMDIDAKKLGADFIAFPGHKGLMGPLGTGGLYVKNPQELNPVITGGTGSNSESLIQPDAMPDMLHSGTLNTPAIAALGSAVRFILKEGAGAIGEYERYLAGVLDEELKNIPGIEIYGSAHKVGITAFNLFDLSSSQTELLLNGKIAVRSGYHCAPLAHRAIGTEKKGAVRVSFGMYNKPRDAKALARCISAAHKI